MTKFFRGGGTIADTISDVPSAIDNMLGNYKKVAIIESQEFNTKANEMVDINLPIDFKFEPSLCYLQVTAFNSSFNFWHDVGAIDIISNEIFLFTTIFDIYSIKKEKNSISFSYKNTDSSYLRAKFKIVAIE